MRYLILTLALFSGRILSAHAGEPGDTIVYATDLQEVVVEGENQELDNGMATYRPLHGQKAAARNAVDLLRLMGIPQLEITPNSLSVSNVHGANVDIFIDKQPATESDLLGMDVRDVLEVQYLAYNPDPQYRNVRYALNFVMRHYEYGGYTRIGASGAYAGRGTDNVAGRLNSKMVYKKMTYDFMASGNADWSRHFSSNSEALYRFADDETMIRDEQVDYSRMRNYGFQTSLRALYQGDKSVASNRLSFVRSGNPYSNIAGTVTIPGQTSPISRHDSQYASMAVWNGNFYFVLPNRFMINVTPSFTYSHTNQRELYRYDKVSGFDNYVKENMYLGSAEVNLTRRHCNTQASSLVFNYGIIHSKDVYTGTTPSKSRFNMNYGGVSLKHVGMFGKVYASVSAGVSFQSDVVNGIHTTKWQPMGMAFAQYTIDRRNQLEAEVRCSVNAPIGSMKSPSVQQANEWLWYTGNPDLTSINNLSASVSYTWLPSNTFYGGVMAQYTGSYDRYVPVYLPLGDEKALVRTFTNDGDYQTVTVGVNATWKLLRNTLQLSARPRVMYFKSTGLYDLDRTSFYTTIMAAYYVHGFFFNASYTPEWRNVDSQGSRNYYKDYLSITAGWSNERWNVSVTANNLFRDNWVNTTSDFRSLCYAVSTTSFSDNRHRNVSLDISYTFRYGKKVRQGDDLNELRQAETTILK